MGRYSTDEEIEDAKNVPFSVDYVFCASYEDIFSKIEASFVKKILPKFRGKELSGLDKLELRR